jgi:hypothetical protein
VMNSRGEYEPRTVSKSYSERSGERKGYKLATRKDSGSREPRYREPTRDKVLVYTVKSVHLYFVNSLPALCVPSIPVWLLAQPANPL